MGDVRLVAPRIRVIREGHDELVVQSDNRDILLWETTRVRHKWPPMTESPFRWMTFLSWAAARRTGAIEASVTYEAWEGSVLSVGDTSQDDSTVDDLTGAPFPEAPGTG